MNRHLALALKLVRRDWQGGELLILLTALLIAVSATTAILMLGDRLHRSLQLQAAEFIGADLAVAGHTPPPSNWTTEAASLGLEAAQTTEFSTVLVEHGELLLVSVKAVSSHYPLRGRLSTRSAAEATATDTDTPPAPGEIWVEPAVLAALKLALGDTVTIGEQPLRITRQIVQEPDRRGDLYSLSPRVIMHQSDLAATQVLQPGSRVHYQSLFSGAPAGLSQLKRWLKPQLAPGQNITDVAEDRPELGKAMERAERYLGLASVAVVLIAGVAIALSARRYSERHQDMTALLKCLGARQRDVFALSVLQLLIIGSAAVAAGCLAGLALQAGMVFSTQALLPKTLAPPGPFSWITGAGLGLLILFGFALPPVLGLRHQPPLRVLRRDLPPLPASALTLYGLASALLILMLSRYLGDLKTSALALGGTALVMAVVGLMALAVLRLLRALRGLVPMWARLGLQQMTRRPRLAVIQILAFTLTLVAMQIILLVRSELIDDWRRHLPAGAPNQFALNLFDADVDRFRDFLSEQKLSASALYPIVRGRLVAINGDNVLTRIGQDAKTNAAINRELSLTWTRELPEDNGLVAGAWPGPTGGVSVEAELAGRLGLKLGDRLRFNIAGVELDTQVDSFRSVRWDTMKPNFYVIFPAGALDPFPHSWLTSFHLPADQKATLLRLAKAFPGVTLLDVDTLMQQLRSILQQIAVAVEFILGLALAAGFLVLFATVRATLDERLREDALMRVMGARQAVLRSARWVEFATLGALAGLLSVCLAEVVLWLLYREVFDLPPRGHLWNWILTPSLAAGVIGWAGDLNTRKVTAQSPMRVLNGL